MKRLTALLTVSLMTASMFTGCGDSSKSEKKLSAYQKTVEEFVDYISDEKYDEAKSMLTFTNVPVKSASFQNFANNQLKNLTYEITDKSDENKIKVTLSSDTETFEVYIIPNGKKYEIHADDFLMDYKVQYISCLSSSHNNFTGKGEYIGNGIQQYEVYTYKADTVTLEHTMLFNDDSIVPNIQTKISFDENYEPSEIISVTNYLDSEESYPGYVVLKDDVVFVDTYGITEDYSRHLAAKFSSVIDSMIGHAIDGSTYDEFSIWNADSIIKDSASIQSYYNDFVSVSDRFYTDTEFDTVVETWNYDKYYHLGDPYIMTINASLHAGNTVGETTTFYVRFVPDEDYFKIDAIGDTYAAVSQEVTEQPSMQQEKPYDSEPLYEYDWQNAYYEYVRKIEDSGHPVEVALIYIDNDEIPELVTSESPVHYTVCSFSDGKINVVDAEGRFEGYIPKKGIYGISAITFSEGEDRFFKEYRFDNGKKEQLHNLKCNVTGMDGGVPSKWDCCYDEKSISKSEYEIICQELIEKYTKPEYSTFNEAISVFNSERGPIEDTTEGIVITENDALNVRTSPSVDAPIIGQVPKGDVVHITGEDGDWYKIRLGSEIGYVSKEYVALTIE